MLHQTQRALLDHDAHDLVQRVGGRHGSQLGIGVVGGLEEWPTPSTSDSETSGRERASPEGGGGSCD
jgi:hypothetical protein